MDDNKVRYEEKDISNEEYKKELLDKGFMSIPVQ